MKFSSYLQLNKAGIYWINSLEKVAEKKYIQIEICIIITWQHVIIQVIEMSGWNHQIDPAETDLFEQADRNLEIDFIALVDSAKRHSKCN